MPEELPVIKTTEGLIVKYLLLSAPMMLEIKAKIQKLFRPICPCYAPLLTKVMGNAR
jgi:hypothetical protein